MKPVKVLLLAVLLFPFGLGAQQRTTASVDAQTVKAAKGLGTLESGAMGGA